jgi:Tol biopolymer transport system component
LPAGSSFRWSPDSRTIGLAVPRSDGHSSIAVVDVGTRRLERLTDGSHSDVLADLSAVGSFAAFYRAGRTENDPPGLWVVGAGRRATPVMTLASGGLGACPLVAWSPKAPVLAIASAACAPS